MSTSTSPKSTSPSNASDLAAPLHTCPNCNSCDVDVTTRDVPGGGSVLASCRRCGHEIVSYGGEKRGTWTQGRRQPIHGSKDTRMPEYETRSRTEADAPPVGRSVAHSTEVKLQHPDHCDVDKPRDR